MPRCSPGLLLANFQDTYARFLTLDAQAPARRDADARSLALSLADKRALADECDRVMRTLSEHLQARTLPATR